MVRIRRSTQLLALALGILFAVWGAVFYLINSYSQSVRTHSDAYYHVVIPMSEVTTDDDLQYVCALENTQVSVYFDTQKYSYTLLQNTPFYMSGGRVQLYRNGTLIREITILPGRRGEDKFLNSSYPPGVYDIRTYGEGYITVLRSGYKYIHLNDFTDARTVDIEGRAFTFYWLLNPSGNNRCSGSIYVTGDAHIYVVALSPQDRPADMPDIEVVMDMPLKKGDNPYQFESKQSDVLLIVENKSPSTIRVNITRTIEVGPRVERKQTVEDFSISTILTASLISILDISISYFYYKDLRNKEKRIESLRSKAGGKTRDERERKKKRKR